MLSGVVAHRAAYLPVLDDLQAHPDAARPRRGLTDLREVRISPAPDRVPLAVLFIGGLQPRGLLNDGQGDHITLVAADDRRRNAQRRGGVRRRVPSDEHPAEWPGRHLLVSLPLAFAPSEATTTSFSPQQMSGVEAISELFSRFAASLIANGHCDWPGRPLTRPAEREPCCGRQGLDGPSGRPGAQFRPATTASSATRAMSM